MLKLNPAIMRTAENAFYVWDIYEQVYEGHQSSESTAIETSYKQKNRSHQKIMHKETEKDFGGKHRNFLRTWRCFSPKIFERLTLYYTFLSYPKNSPYFAWVSNNVDYQSCINPALPILSTMVVSFLYVNIDYNEIFSDVPVASLSPILVFKLRRLKVLALFTWSLCSKSLKEL